MDPGTYVISSAIHGQARPVVDLLPSGLTLTWAFATGECGQESFGGFDAKRIAAVNVPAFERAGVAYVVATGGEGGVFTCASDAGMEAFIARYNSALLRGIDFDIESGQTREMVDSIVRRVRAAQVRHPHLRFSFTLPTLAAEQGAANGLASPGRAVLDAIRREALVGYTINLMAMDYGNPSVDRCVLKRLDDRTVCDMGLSAVRAVENLHARYQVPYGQIELTTMIGVNDVDANDFLPSDVEVISRFAQSRGLAAIHFWAFDRDVACSGLLAGASSTCHGMDGLQPGHYADAFAAAMR